MKIFTLVILAFIFTACSIPPGSTYEITTPEGFIAKVTTSSNSEELVFRMKRSGDDVEVELTKLKTSNSDALAYRGNSVDSAAGVASEAISFFANPIRGAIP
jgi:hypothetical protein